MTGDADGRNNADGTGTGEPPTERLPRRLVLLADGETSAVSRVLLEYRGADVRGTRIHADLQKCAAEHAGRYVAAEWLGPLGWTRYLWCRK